MIVLIGHLYRRVMRRGRVISLLALSSVPGLAYWLAGFDAEPLDLEFLYSDIVATAGFSFAIAVAIVTTATLREERDGGTLPYIYMRPIPRLAWAASAIAAGVGAALTFAIGGWLATVVAVLAVGTEVSIALPGLVLFVVAAVGYAAVFVALGYFVPRSLLVALGYIIIIESILAGAVTGFAQISLWRISLSVYAGIADMLGTTAEEVLGPITPGVGGGLVKTAGVLVVGWAVLTWALRRRDAL